MELNVIEQIRRFQEFIEINYYNILLENARKGNKFLLIDFSELSKYDPDLANELLDSPEETIKAIEKAIEQFDIDGLLNFKVRIKNLPTTNKHLIGNIRSNLLGKLICIGGFLLRKSEVKPRVISIRFECSACSTILNILQLGVEIKEPKRCGCGFKGKFIQLDKELIDVQSLVVQEKQDELEGAAQPQRVHALLQQDLVVPHKERKLNPGSVITINGVVKEIPVMLRSGGLSVNYDLLVEVNHIEIIGESFQDIEITKEAEEKIIEVSKNNPLKLLVESTAPTIYGNYEVKEAAILQLFGGVRKILQDGREVRGDSHILIIGDPGAAKTALIRYLTKLAPKWQYISGGAGASKVGIAAAVVKDELIKGFTLDAGAAVLAHDGILFFDELDKMEVEERGALHEIMESQSFTVHKAGINATLLARATILAAANPKEGRFDPYKELYQQLNLPPTLINRFDLVFPLKDIPEVEKDEKMSRHILKAHRRKLVMETTLSNPFTDKKFAREYIGYARRNIFPELTDEAEEVIHQYYTNLRKQGGVEESGSKAMAIPINPRYLEAIVRLAESSARSRLSKNVEKEDAIKAVELVDFCLKQFGFDPVTQKIDIDRISGIARPASKREKTKIVLDVIRESIFSLGKMSSDQQIVSVYETAKICSFKGITESEFEEIINYLKQEATLYEPRSGYIGFAGGISRFIEEEKV